MFTEIKLTESLIEYVFPDTHKEQGRQVAKIAGTVVCGIFWISTVFEFTHIVTELNHYGSIIAVLERFGRSFFLFVAAMFWLVSALCIYSTPRVFGIVCIGYILTAYIGLLVFGVAKPYLSITNYFLNFIAVFVFVQVVLAGVRAPKQSS